MTHPGMPLPDDPSSGWPPAGGPPPPVPEREPGPQPDPVPQPVAQHGRHRRPGGWHELGFNAGPLVVAAAATAILVLFGLGAVLVPVLFDDDPPQRAPIGAGEGGGDIEPTQSPTPEPTPSLTPTPKPSATRTPSRTPSGRPSASGRPEYEDRVLQLVNAERAEADTPCQPLKHDSRLRTAARGHSVDMAVRNYFSHTGKDGSSPTDRARRAGYPNAVSENIAAGQRSPESVMRAWMNSSGHRANILNCRATSIGIGIAYRGRTPYWTQNFGRD